VALSTSEFGPFRAIGLGYVGKGHEGEIPALWGTLLPRMDEVKRPGGGGSFGVCRCASGGVKDGSFEYIAALAADDDANVPPGMMEVLIPRGNYAVFRVERLAEVQSAWDPAASTLAASPEWTGYCGRSGCDCANHPCFEYYPPEFNGDGPLYLYFPIQPKL